METLANWLHRRGPFHPRDAVGWAIRLAKTLEALHQHGVAHGNVSPACVIVESNDPRSRGMIADVRRTAEMIQYHSPERLRDGQLSPADDTWGVAGTLFSVLTTARPFGELQQEIIARLPHGPPSLAAYRIQDEALNAILAAALSPDPSRRIGHVTHLRQHLERWFNDPAVFQLKALEDEETGEEDAAATAMMDQIFDDPRMSAPDSNIFAPPSFVQSQGGRPVPSSQVATTRQPPPSRPGPMPAQPPPPAASPLGEQDATVMRELPAHIMALAARAAGGSNPPPPPDNADEDAGGATRVGNTADIAAAMQNAREPLAPPAPPPGPPPGVLAPPPSQPSGPTSPRPPAGRPPRAIRSTQLGVGLPQMPLPPQPPQPPPPPQPPGAPGPPRAGFAPPPTTLSSAPPPRDPDEVRTVMHPVAESLKSLGHPNLPPAPNLGQPPPNVAPNVAPPQVSDVDADDDDDGGRTVLRESPGFDEFLRAPDPGAAPPGPQAQWKPAAPPLQPRAVGSTERPQAPPGGPGPGGGVSALIQDTLEQMNAPSPAGGPPPGFPPPTDFAPAPVEWGGQLGPGQPGQSQLGPSQLGPSQPGPQPGPFAPMTSGPFAPVGPGGYQPATGQGAEPTVGLPPQMPIGPSPENVPAGDPRADAPPPGGYPLGSGVASVAQPPKKSSRLGLFIVCVLVLILAAALTFIFLRYRHLLTFLPPELRGAPPQ